MVPNKSGSSLFDIVNSNEDDLSFCKRSDGYERDSLVSLPFFAGCAGRLRCLCLTERMETIIRLRGKMKPWRARNVKLCFKNAQFQNLV